MSGSRFTDAYMRFHDLARQTLLPPIKPGTYKNPDKIRRSPRAPVQIRAFAPSPLPRIPPKSGYETYEKRTVTTKVKRMWYPNYRPHSLPVGLLAGRQGAEGKRMMSMPVKLRIEDVEEIERAGGLESYLMYTPSSKLSNHGKLLRQALFQELNRMRTTGTCYAGPSKSPSLASRPAMSSWFPSGSSSTSRNQHLGIDAAEDGPGLLPGVSPSEEGAEEVVLGIEDAGKSRERRGRGTKRYGARAGMKGFEPNPTSGVDAA